MGIEPLTSYMKFTNPLRDAFSAHKYTTNSTQQLNGKNTLHEVTRKNQLWMQTYCVFNFVLGFLSAVESTLLVFN